MVVSSVGLGAVPVAAAALQTDLTHSEILPFPPAARPQDSFSRVVSRSRTMSFLGVAMPRS